VSWNQLCHVSQPVAFSFQVVKQDPPDNEELGRGDSGSSEEADERVDLVMSDASDDSAAPGGAAQWVEGPL